MRRKQNNKIFKYLPVLIILLSITIMIGSTLAFFSDKTEKSGDLIFDKIELSNETSVGFNGEILDLIPGATIVDYPISFSKAIDSAPLYVRAKLSFSLPERYRDDVKMQEFLNALRQSSDLNIFNEEQNGAVWSAKQGSYFYLVDKDAQTRLKVVNDIYTYTLSQQIKIPRNLDQVENNYLYMKQINFHIAFEAIQADNVSNVLKDTKLIFNDIFPSGEATGAEVNVTLKDFNLVDVLEVLQYQEGDTVFEPIIELPTDDNGNTTISVEDWYVDKDLTIPYVFGNKIYEDITLYPKTIEIAEGLEFIPIYKDLNIIAYKVAIGTCSLTDIKLPSWYNYKQVTTIAEDGFRDCVNITNLVLSPKTTTIEANAFNGCSGLITMRIPESVTSIGEDAFLGCMFTTTVTPSVENWLKIEFEKENANPINISKNLYVENNVATYSVRSTSAVLKHLEPSENIKKINAYAFYNCHTLESVTLGENITEIGEYAFYGCFNITEVNVQGEPKIEEGAFQGTNADIPIVPKPGGSGSGGSNDDDVSVGGYGDTGIKNADIPEGVTSIEEGGFKNCGNLANVSLPSTLTSIGDDAFKNCTNLKEIIIPAGVTYIGSGAFSGCTGLNKIIIDYTDKDSGTGGDTFKDDYYFEEDAFVDSEIKNVEIKGKTALEIWLSIKFGNEYSNPIFYAKKLTLDGQLLTHLVIPESITVINAYALINCESLRSTVVSSQVTEINDKAFYGCIYNKVVTNHSQLDIVAGEITHGYVAYYVLDNGLTYSAVYDNPYSSNRKFIGYSVAQGLCNLSVLAIPATYDNEPVIQISSNGFKNNTNLTQVILPDTITTIQKGAFANCTSLKSVNIPKKVTSIGEAAFGSCTSLENFEFDAASMPDLDYNYGLILSNSGNAEVGLSVTIGKTVKKIPAGLLRLCSNVTSIVFEQGSVCEYIGHYAFEGCNITEIVLPESIKTLNSYIFKDCVNLTSATLPGSTTQVGNYMFYHCSKLENVVLSDSITTIGNGAFSNCVLLKEINLPNNLTTISDDAFIGCSVLEEINLPNTITTIGKFAFSNCVALKEIELPQGLRAINNYTFNNCDSLTNIALPENIISIGEGAFKSCDLLETITMFDKITNIGNKAFMDCIALKTITIPEKVTTLGLSVYANCTNVTTINYNAKTIPNCKDTNEMFYRVGVSTDGVTLNIGSKVQIIPAYMFTVSNASCVPYITQILFEEDSECLTIGAYAFKNLSNITEINLPNSLITIYDNAFYNWSSLESIIIGDNVTTIGAYAFCNCSALSSIVIGKNVTTIGSYVLYNCNLLSDITYNAINATAFDRAFSNLKSNVERMTMFIGKDVEIIPDHFTSGCQFDLITFEEGNKCKEIKEYAFNGQTKIKEFVLPDTIELIGSYSFKGSYIETLKLPSSLTTVDEHAFENCTKLKDITFNDNLTTIKDYAFASLSALEAIELKERVIEIGTHAFYRCEKVTSLTLPNSLTTIGSYAFYFLQLVQTLTIPENVTSIGTYAFAYWYDLTTINYNAKNVTSANSEIFSLGCDNATKVIIGEDVELIPSRLFYSSNYYPNITTLQFKGSKVKSIGQYAFYNLNITALNIPEGVESVGEYAFYSCDNIKTLTLPTTVTSIKYCAFQACTGITTLTIQSDIELGGSVFKSCTKLSTVKVLSGLTHIGNEMFYGCNVLKTVELADSVEVIRSKAFYNCSALVNLTLSNNITTIGESAFYACNKLTTITLPTSLINIGEYAFYNCTLLNKVVMSDNVENIGIWAFGYCSALTTINLSDKLTTLEIAVFSNCTSLKTFDFNNITSISNSALANCNGITALTIPSSVTEIGENAFAECTRLVNLTIDSTFTNKSTTNGSFSNYSNVFINAGTMSTGITVTFGENVTMVPSYLFAVNDTTKVPRIISVEFEGASCKSIGGYAFSGGKFLRTLEIPEGLITIGNYAFSGVDLLETINYKAIEEVSVLYGAITKNENTKNITVNIDKNVKYVSPVLAYLTCVEAVNFEEGSVCETLSGAFKNSLFTSINLPNSLKEIGGSTFNGCVNLTSIDIPDSVTRIGGSAFVGCTSLGSVNLPDELEIIEGSAFSGCAAITSIELPSKLKEISTTAFAGTNITEITIPESVTKIGKDAFANMKKLTQINYNAIVAQTQNYEGVFTSSGVTNGVTINIGVNVLVIPQGLFSSTTTTNALNIKSVTFAQGSKCLEIERYAFAYNEKITNFTFPSDLITIGDHAFYNCKNLKFSSIPNGVTRIERYTFYNCPLLQVVTLPNALTFIGNNAFYGCRMLMVGELPNTVTTIEYNAFYECRLLNITKIPEGVRTIQSGTFFSSGITQLTFGSHIGSIGVGAFRLTSVKVNFDGTAEEFSNISIDINNEPVTNNVVYLWDSATRIEPTCTSEGKIIYTRGEGDSLETKEVILEKIPHTFSDDVCSHCGYKKFTRLTSCNFEQKEYGSYYYQKNTELNYTTYEIKIAVDNDCEFVITWEVWATLVDNNKDKFTIKVNDVALEDVDGVYGNVSGENTLTLKAGDVVIIEYALDTEWDSVFGVRFSYTESETTVG